VTSTRSPTRRRLRIGRRPLAAAGTVLVPAESADELLVARPNGVVTATRVGTNTHDATSVGGHVFVAGREAGLLERITPHRSVR
jgi:hypothetical protein